MKTVIFYFSGTGNTWWASQELKYELEKLKHTVEVYSLENPILKEENKINDIIKSNEHIVIGYPTYGSDLPLNMRAFVKNLPSITNHSKTFSAFCTQAGFTGDGNIYFKADVEGKGYKFSQSIQLTLTTNFNVAMFPFSLSKPAEGKKLEKKKTKTLKKIQKLAKCITNNIEYIEGSSFYLALPGKLQRHFFRIGEKKMSKKFKFFRERCVHCNLCVKSCPVNNWSFDNEGNLKNSEKCILCFRCYNFCPTKAINFGKNVKDPEKYKRFRGPIENMKLSDIRK